MIIVLIKTKKKRYSGNWKVLIGRRAAPLLTRILYGLTDGAANDAETRQNDIDTWSADYNERVLIKLEFLSENGFGEIDFETNRAQVSERIHIFISQELFLKSALIMGNTILNLLNLNASSERCDAFCLVIT